MLLTNVSVKPNSINQDIFMHFIRTCLYGDILIYILLFLKESDTIYKYYFRCSLLKINLKETTKSYFDNLLYTLNHLKSSIAKSDGYYLLRILFENSGSQNLKYYYKVCFSTSLFGDWERTIFSYISIIMYMLLFFLIFKFLNIRISKTKKLELDLITLELKSLKNQMNPHFLFNALNNLQSIIFTHGAEQANLYLCKFSTLMRLTLEITRNNTISLKDELKYIRTYLEFEQLRTNDELLVTYDIEDSLEISKIEIPVMVVQTIIENAINHGLIPSKKKKNGC
jgi:hypothetical protein